MTTNNNTARKTVRFSKNKNLCTKCTRKEERTAKKQQQHEKCSKKSPVRRFISRKFRMQMRVAACLFVVMLFIAVFIALLQLWKVACTASQMAGVKNARAHDALSQHLSR